MSGSSQDRIPHSLSECDAQLPLISPGNVLLVWVLRLTRIPSDVRRILRTSKLHTKWPFLRSYPKPELKSLQLLYELHRQHFGKDFDLFNLKEKEPKISGEAMCDRIKKSMEKTFSRSKPIQLIDPHLHLVFKRIETFGRKIEKIYWYNTEPKNGCIRLLFTYILEVLSDPATADLSRLIDFLIAAIHNRRIFPGNSTLLRKCRREIKSIALLIRNIQKIKETEKDNQTQSSHVCDIRDALHAYLVITINNSLQLLLKNSEFNILDPDYFSRKKGINDPFWDFLTKIHQVLLFPKDIHPIPTQVYINSSRQYIHPIFRSHSASCESLRSLVSNTEIILKQINATLPLFQAIYNGNREESNRMQIIESEIYQTSIDTQKSISDLKEKLDTLEKLRQEIIDSSKERCCDSELPRGWIDKNYIPSTTGRNQEKGYLEVCRDYVKEYQKQINPEEQKKLKEDRKGIIRDMEENRRTFEACNRHSLLYSPAVPSPEYPPPIESIFASIRVF